MKHWLNDTMNNCFRKIKNIQWLPVVLMLFVISVLSACKDNQECFDENNDYVVGNFFARNEDGTLQEQPVAVPIDSMIAITESGQQKVITQDDEGNSQPITLGTEFRMELSPHDRAITYYIEQAGFGDTIQFTYSVLPRFISEACGVGFVYKDLTMAISDQGKQVFPEGEVLQTDLKSGLPNIQFVLECHPEYNDYVKVDFQNLAGEPELYQFDSIYTVFPDNTYINILKGLQRTSVDLPIALGLTSQDYYLVREGITSKLNVQVNARRYLTGSGCGPGVVYTQLKVQGAPDASINKIETVQTEILSDDNTNVKILFNPLTGN